MSRALGHIVLVILSVFISVIACAQDIPPGVPNMQSFASGSYVIPMDNDKQALNGEPFNLSSYGLIYNLLEQGVPLHWVIKSGKDKDEVDFSALASRMYPTPTGSAMLDFRASAFIIDVSNVQAEVSCGGITNSVVEQTILLFGNQVAVYRLDQDVTVDVRYTLTNAPVIAVLTDGSAEETEEQVLDYAHVPYSSVDYATFAATNTCYTFIAQPHLSNSTGGGGGGGNLDIAAYTAIITSFLNAGGNFFAQCASIPTFENEASYLTAGTVTGVSQTVLGTGFTYDNNDMPVMQFHGNVEGFGTGSTSYFTLDAGVNFQSYAYTGAWKVDASGDNGYLVAAGDLNGAALGGNVFYLGGHDYTPQENLESQDGSNTFTSDVIESYNLNRVALNAAFVPAAWVATCVSADRCICPGQSVNIGCSDVANTQYTWSPATGLSCTDCPNPVASPSVTTTYTAAGPGGCSANEVTVIIDCPIVVASEDVICEGECATITIDAQISNTPVTLYIDGVSQPFTSTVTTLCPTENTTFQFEVVDDQGISYTDDVLVEVHPAQTASISSTNEICSGEIITFSASGVSNPIWSTTEAISCTTCASPTLELANDFSITVSGEDANGCPVNDDFSMSVYETPMVEIAASAGDYCEGTTITLTASGADTYLWPATGETTPSISYTLNTTETLSVTGIMVSGCTATAELELPVSPIIPIVIEDQIFLCITDSCVTLNAANVTSVEWMLDDGTVISNELNVQVCPQVPTVYTAQTTNEGCFEPDDVLVNIVLVPEVVASNDTLICPGQPVYLSAQGADNYIWTDAMGNVLSGASPLIAPLFSQQYEVVGTTAEGCTSSDLVTITTLPSPVAEFEVVAPDGFFTELPIYFQNASIQADCFIWDVHDNPHYGSTTENFMHVFHDPGEYPVELTVCNQLGCWDTVMHTIYLGSEFYYYVPTAFTPNSDDDLNSYFKVYGVNISENDFKLSIFNRWGELIYVVNHPDDVWLGNHYSDEQYFVPDGVYNWQLRLRDKHTLMQYEAKGHVVIFR
jgi:gliding motility-associated-like protein